jgi:nitrogen fixation protein NifU and related proteins
MDMYRELILDHARTPHHPGVLNPADFDHEEHNPLCGDRLHLTLRVNENRLITDVAWDGEGSAKQPPQCWVMRLWAKRWTK